MAAWDLLQLPVLAPDLWEPHQQQAREEDAAHEAAMLERATAWRKERGPDALTYPASAAEGEEDEATSAGDDFDFIDEDNNDAYEHEMPPPQQQQHTGARGNGIADNSGSGSGGVASFVKPRRREGAGNAGAGDDDREGSSASAMLSRPSAAKLARIERNNAVIFGRQEGQGAGRGERVPKDPKEGRGLGSGRSNSVTGDDATMHNILQALTPEDDGFATPAGGGMLAGSQRRSAGVGVAASHEWTGRDSGEVVMSAVVKGGGGGL